MDRAPGPCHLVIIPSVAGFGTLRGLMAGMDRSPTCTATSATRWHLSPRGAYGRRVCRCDHRGRWTGSWTVPVDLDVLGGPPGQLIPPIRRADRHAGGPQMVRLSSVRPQAWPAEPDTERLRPRTRTLKAYQIDDEPEIHITANQNPRIDLEDCATDLTVVQERVTCRTPLGPHARATQLPSVNWLTG